MRATLLAAALLGFYVSGAEPRPQAGECSAACDKAAATCVDACEDKFGNDAPARVACKVKCAEQRAACDKACP